MAGLRWTSGEDTALFGAGAEAALEAAETALLVGEWPEDHVWRCATQDGAAAWLWLTNRDTLSCMAVAPWAEAWDLPHVPAVPFFSMRMPAHWRVKGYVRMTQERKAARDASFNDYAAGWACGMLPDKACMLVKVAEMGEGVPRHVHTMKDGPAVPANVLGVVRWFGLSKWPEGLAQLWDSGVTRFANYPFLAIRAGYAQDPNKARLTRKANTAARKKEDNLKKEVARNPIRA